MDSQVKSEERGGEGPQREAEQQTTGKEEESLSEVKQDGEAQETTTAPNFDLPEDLKVCLRRNKKKGTIPCLLDSPGLGTQTQVFHILTISCTLIDAMDLTD